MTHSFLRTLMGDAFYALKLWLIFGSIMTACMWTLYLLAKIFLGGLGA